nr:proline-rich protein 36-like [Aegilops tauschii subsp. strangulata]
MAEQRRRGRDEGGVVIIDDSDDDDAPPPSRGARVKEEKADDGGDDGDFSAFSKGNPNPLPLSHSPPRRHSLSPSPLDPIWIGEGPDPDAARIDRIHRRPRTAKPSSPDCLPAVLSVTYTRLRASSPSSPTSRYPEPRRPLCPANAGEALGLLFSPLPLRSSIARAGRARATALTSPRTSRRRCYARPPRPHSGLLRNAQHAASLSCPPLTLAPSPRSSPLSLAALIAPATPCPCSRAYTPRRAHPARSPCCSSACLSGLRPHKRAAAAFSRSRLLPWSRVPAPTPLLLASPPPVPLLLVLPRAAAFGPSLLAASPTRLWPLLAVVDHSPPPPCCPPAGVPSVDRPASPASFAAAPLGVAPLAPPVNHLLFADDILLFSKASVDAANEVIPLLLSKDCSKSVRLEVKNQLQVPNESLSAKYLGLPSDVGSSKNGSFKYLKDYLWSKA